MKWQLPVRERVLEGKEDWVHPLVKAHFFVDNTSLCGRYWQLTDFYQTDVKAELITKEPQYACKKCYEKWLKRNANNTNRTLGEQEMTEQEAIIELSYDNTAYGGRCTEEVRKIAIKALEKQIPKKNIGNILGVYCSECNHFLDGTEYYCQSCGQKLDWT